MRTLLLIVGLLALAAILWDIGWSLTGLGQVMPWTLKKELAAGETPLLIDVRTPMEYRWFHIDGALNLPFGTDGAMERLAELAAENPGRGLVIICMTGHRSPMVAWRLMKQGLLHGEATARNLTWGMTGWVLTGGETVSGE